MSFSSNHRMIATASSVMVLTLTLLALSPSPAAAQGYCAQYTATLLDTTVSCVNEPWRPRASEVQTFRWKGHDYMIFNEGNELGLYRVDNPASPQHIDTSTFGFDTRGDSDYDLIDFDVCDDCRYGVLAHKVEGTVVFDFGIGTVPSFGYGAYAIHENAPGNPGGIVFSKGGQQYMIADNMSAGCYFSGLYMVNGLDQIDFLQCGEVGGAGVEIRGLRTITDSSGVLYLYLAERAGPVHVFRADGSGAGLTLVYETSPAGMYGVSDSLSIDVANKRAASADYFGEVVGIWDLSTPDSPWRRYSIPIQAGMVSLRSPSAGAPSTLFTAVLGRPDSTHTYVVEDTGYQPVVDENFWYDNALPHNPEEICAFESGGELSRDGSVLFLSRYAVHQVFDLSECLTPTPAIADLEVTPGGEWPTPAVFPGQSIEVRDVSTGVVDEWALWITRNGNLVKGSDQLNTTNARTLSYTIPKALTASDTIVAHVEVDSSELTPDVPYRELTVNIDRTPQASFTIEPSAVVVGDTVTLTASAEGVVGAGGYQWQITNPSGSTASRTGQVVTYTLNQSGDWDFVLTVGYDHQDPASPPSLYEATYSVLDYAVSSVAADFTWSPTNPLHTQQITLDGSISKPSTGLTYAWEVKLGGTVVFACSASSVKTCVIPPETLSPDTTYNVTLTASNGPESSVKTKPMTVGNGNVNPTISWSPSNPEIGESVIFTIEGVPADLDSASWNMGGPGCDGADSTPDCQPGLWNNCKSQSYAYSSSSTKTVTLEIEVGGNTFTAPPVQVSVQPTGSCNTAPPPNCTYSFSPSSVEFGPGGGETAVTVNTQSGCSWTATTLTPWLTVVAPSGAISGSGSLRFRADANTGPYRTGSIIAGGKGLVVNQRPPDVPVYFTMSNNRPEIGEVVTFSADPILEVASWDFGEADCRGVDPAVNCYFSSCNTIQWTFTTRGSKSVTMTLTDGRYKTRTPLVSNSGECCLADGRPDADFTLSAEEAYAGETITFTDLSQKSIVVSTEALSFSWSPQNPEIGENVTFMLEGLTGDVEQATWNFGETGCDGLAAEQSCTPSLWNDCKAMSFTFASASDKPVTATVTLEGGSPQTIGPRVVTIANAGECPGGGGGGPVCSYVVDPTLATYPADGGSGTFDVTTTQDCEWSPKNYSSWIHIGSGGGFGSGAVTYSVDPNPSSNSRSALIYVENKTHRVTQAGDQGDTAPTAWRWTVTRVLDEDGEEVDEDYYSSTDQHTSYRFLDPGRYRVSLTAINCYGTSSTHHYVEILEAPVEAFVIGAAVSLAGENDTHWESDLRFYNPCGEDLDVRIEYLPENTNNLGAELVFREFMLLPNQTRVFGHINDAIPGLDNPVSGSVRIDSTSDSGCKVLSVSRTFNDTPDGSLGLFVPAFPIKRLGRDFLDLNGLIHNQEYRTNLRLVNYSDEDMWVPLQAYDKGGNPVGERRSVSVKAQSTKQINAISEWLSVPETPDPFVVRAEVDGLDVQALGTVVDNLTGDSVLYLSSFHDENQIWLVGAASLSGVNDSQWRTDVWLYNPTDDWLGGEMEFVVGDNPDDSYGFQWPTLGSHRTKQYLDIVSDELGLEETRGYIVLTGEDGGPAPQIAARTYNLDPSGGTYGLNLRAYGSADLLQPGEVGYIAGISNSADQSVGFRTNVGVLNTDRDGWTTVRITMYDLVGNEAAEPFETTIAPGKLRQFDVFKRFGLGDVTMTGSLMIEAVSGGAVAVYATEIDNRTQDSIFIPAQRLFMGLAR